MLLLQNNNTLIIDHACVLPAGGADHTVQLFDAGRGVVAASLTGHSKKVTSLAFASRTALLSASADKTVKLWAADGAAAWSLAAPALGTAAAAVARVCVHPVTSLAVAVDAAAAWQLLDVPVARPVAAGSAAAAGAFLSAAVHPDGHFFAAGGRDGGVQVCARLCVSHEIACF